MVQFTLTLPMPDDRRLGFVSAFRPSKLSSSLLALHSLQVA